MVDVNEALPKRSVPPLEIEAASLTPWTVVLDGFGPGLRITLIAVNRDALHCPFDVFFHPGYLIRKGVSVTFRDNREAIFFKNPETLGLQPPLEVVGTERFAGESACSQTDNGLRRITATLEQHVVAGRFAKPMALAPVKVADGCNDVLARNSIWNFV